MEAEAARRDLQAANVSGPELAEADLSGFRLVEAVFGNGKETVLNSADFRGADLWRATFQGPHLHLRSANFTGANLLETVFADADLAGSVFARAHLRSTSFVRTRLADVLLAEVTRFDNVRFVGVEWDPSKINCYERSREFAEAQRVYSMLRQAYEREGDSRTAGEFFYREMECLRKGAPRRSYRLWYGLSYLFWGYGEKPLRVLATGGVTVLFFAILFHFLGGAGAFLDRLYLSAVSFSALGYGSWVSEPTNLLRILAVGETMLGVVLMGTFVATLIRRLLR